MASRQAGSNDLGNQSIARLPRAPYAEGSDNYQGQVKFTRSVAHQQGRRGLRSTINSSGIQWCIFGDKAWMVPVFGATPKMYESFNAVFGRCFQNTERAKHVDPESAALVLVIIFHAIARAMNDVRWPHRSHCRRYAIVRADIK